MDETPDRSSHEDDPPRQILGYLVGVMARTLSPEEFERWVRTPPSEEEETEQREFLAWFHRRYPTEVERLAWARGAWARWKKSLPPEVPRARGKARPLQEVWLDGINQALGTELRYPAEPPDPETAQILELIAVAIEDGRVAVPPMGTPVIEAPRDIALELVSLWRTGRKLDVIGVRTAPFVVWRTELPVGPVTFRCEEIDPPGDLDSLEQRARSLREGETLTIPLACQRIVYEFTRFVKV